MDSLLPAVRKLTKGEARYLCDHINECINDARAKLLELYEGKGWEALGYDSWRACVVTEFGQSRRYLYYQLRAARIEQELCTIVQNEPIPEAQLRPLAQLDSPEQRRKAWSKAVESAPNGKPTAKQVEAAVAEVTGREPAPDLRRKAVADMFAPGVGVAAGPDDEPSAVATATTDLVPVGSYYRPLPGQLSMLPDDEPKDEPAGGDRKAPWIKFFGQLNMFFVSLPRRGGILGLARLWTPKERESAVIHLEMLRDQCEQSLAELRRS